MRTAENVMLLETEVSEVDKVRLAPRASWRDVGSSDHFVQFYEKDAFLIQSVSSFIGEGLSNGENAIVIATKEHREALREALDGMDEVSGNEYISLDAEETLAKFMINGVPDETLFLKTVGSLVERVARNGRKIRAFGEMVALLWAEGNKNAAIQLEELWNHLMESYSFSLFCAYPLEGFAGDSEAEPLVHICRAHSHVIPAESYAAATDTSQRLRSITLLQQKAASLKTEVAQRHKVESEMAGEKIKFDLAADIAGLGVIEMDLTTQELFPTDQGKAHFGLAPEERLTYEKALQLIHPDDREEMEGAIRQSAALGGEFKKEYRVIDAAGNFRWIAASGRCLDNGRRRLLTVTQDITDRKRSSEILEQTIAERTGKLEEIIAELEGFSYSISHDMRSPLRAMQGYAKALLHDHGGQLDPVATGYLQRIERVSSRLDMLIRDILAYSKIAKEEIELKSLDLDILIADILDHPEFETWKNCITIDGSLGRVMGHEAYLTQCISNLVDNALKFIKPGSRPQVRIHSQEVGSDLRLCVTDAGLGIHPEHYHRIFQIFGRIYSDKKYRGTGIGLAIVKKGVARMGGQTGFESTWGTGTTFWFTLPKARHGV